MNEVEAMCTICVYRDTLMDHEPCNRCISEGWDVKQIHEWERGGQNEE